MDDAVIDARNPPMNAYDHMSSMSPWQIVYPPIALNPIVYSYPSYAQYTACPISCTNTNGMSSTNTSTPALNSNNTMEKMKD